MPSRTAEGTASIFNSQYGTLWSLRSSQLEAPDRSRCNDPAIVPLQIEDHDTLSLELPGWMGGLGDGEPVDIGRRHSAGEKQRDLTSIWHEHAGSRRTVQFPFSDSGTPEVDLRFADIASDLSSTPTMLIKGATCSARCGHTRMRWLHGVDSHSTFEVEAGLMFCLSFLMERKAPR